MTQQNYTATIRLGPLGLKNAALFKVPPGAPRVDKHARWLGHLKGHWQEIGREYGERCGDLMRWIYDKWIGWAIINPKGKKNSILTIVEDAYKYEQHIRLLNPGLVAFMKGIADGAGRELDRAEHANTCSNYEKVLFMNCYSLIRRNSPVAQGRWGECTGLAVLPKASKEGKTLVGHNTQYGLSMGLYAVTYIASPEGFNTFWSLAPAGNITWNVQMNDKGVVIAEFAGGKGDDALGVPSFLLQTDAIARANNLQEAVDILTLGNEDYRNQSGRKTVLREGGGNWIVADQGNACVVETTGRRYAVRFPGDLGEKDFLIGSNIQFCSFSFDEENVKTDIPMSKFGCDEGGDLPVPGPCTRYWSLYWGAMHNYGRMDEELLRSAQFLAGHHWYDRSGNRIDYVKDEKGQWIPVHYAHDHSTVCGHSGGYPEKFNNECPFSKIASVDDKIISWTLGRACSWEGDWDSVVLPLKAS